MPKDALSQSPNLKDSIAEFLLDRQIRRVSAGTLGWHKRALGKWSAYCGSITVSHPTQVTPTILRQYIAKLQEAHNAGGVSNLYRSVRTYLLWYETEYTPAGWHSPTRKVKVSTGEDDALDPISLDHFGALIATCERKTFAGCRDRAILYVLLDTGVRRQELCDLEVRDVDIATGAISVRRGKGGKARTVFLGVNSRRVLMQYLRYHKRLTDALWTTDAGAPLTNDGIRTMVRRRARIAQIPEPGLHSFRRAFALNFLRNGGDVLSLQRLLGHASLDIINRYVKLITADIAAAHMAYGVVDRL